MGFSRQTITHADAGLALLSAGDMSDLAVRMRTVRALVSTNVGGIDAATVELTRVIDAIGNERPLALGCLLRDRGWLNFRDGNPDQALDDLLRAYALLRRWRAARKPWWPPAASRWRSSRCATTRRRWQLVDETIAFFREQKAQIRLATALDRRAPSSRPPAVSTKRCWPPKSAEDPRRHRRPRRHGLSQMSMCGVLIERNALKEAGEWCDRAELTLSQTSGMDDNDYRTLARLRGRLYLALGRSKEAVAQFDRAIAPGGAQPADDIAELYELRSRAHAAARRLPRRLQRPGRIPATHARTGHAGSHSRSRAAARAVRERPGEAEDRAAREGQETRRGAAQQPDAHHAAGSHRRAHRPRDRVLPRLCTALQSAGIEPN
jgi:tetratricopeptide (TPR) repeat protein